MSVAADKTGAETRPILAPTDNRVRVFEEQGRKKEMAKKPAEKPKKVISQSLAKQAAHTAAAAVVRCNVSAESSSDSTTSSSSSASSSSGLNVKSSKSMGPRRVKNGNAVVKAAKIVPHGIEALTISPAVPLPVKRCDWITPNSEPLYASFHDEEWGVPVHDDIKLFELLVLSQALAELPWPIILSKRAVFRKLLDDFNPTSVANLEEEMFLSKRVQGSLSLSEPKLRAIVGNAKQLLKIQQEFGSFSNYCWRFVNHKPIKSGYRFARQVPAKTAKSELISRDLLQRGFRCVGPTIVYSFMQVAGLVNDHFVTCFRYNECSHVAEKDHKRQQPEETVEKNCKSDESSPEPKVSS